MDTFEFGKPNKPQSRPAPAHAAPYSAAAGTEKRIAGGRRVAHDSRKIAADVNDARSGDRKALKRLFEAFKDPVYRTSLLLLSNRKAAEAVTEEVFVRFAESPPAEGTRFEIWCLRSAIDICTNIIEGRDTTTVPSERVKIDERDRGTAIRRLIASKLNGVAPNARIAFVLCEGLGLTYDEMGAITGQSIEDLAVDLAAARADLAGVLEQIEFEGWNGR